MADDLNREIAECLGWEPGLYPITGNPGAWYTREGYIKSEVPRYATDPAACLELLTYVTSLEEVLQVACHRSYAGQARCYVLFRKSQEAHEGSADTLQEAIARACLAALKAVREGQAP